MPYPEELINKYNAVAQGASDTNRTGPERATARKIKERMEQKYPGLADEARRAAASTPRGFSGFTGSAPPPPFGFADWMSFISAGATSFVDFLSKVSAELDHANDRTDARSAVDRVEIKRRASEKTGIVSLRFDFTIDDVTDMVRDDNTFDASAKRFGEIAEAAFRNSFGDGEDDEDDEE